MRNVGSFSKIRFSEEGQFAASNPTYVTVRFEGGKELSSESAKDRMTFLTFYCFEYFSFKATAARSSALNYRWDTFTLYLHRGIPNNQPEQITSTN